MLCCVCVCNASGVAIGVFGNIGTQLSIAQTIDKHLWFKPKSNDKICENCWRTLKEFHEFYETVQKAHKQLEENETVLIKEEEDEGHAPESVTTIKDEFDEPSEEEKPPNQLEVEMETNLSNIAMTANEVEKNPLEDDDHHHGIIDGDVDGYDSQHDSLYDADYVAASSAPSSSSSSSSSAEDDHQPVETGTTNEKISKVKRKRRKQSMEESKKDESIAPRKKRKRLDPKLTEQMIQKHISMICNLCNFDCKTFVEVGKHFKECHPKIKPYIMCCNKRFTRRHYIAQHALQHEDPNCFRCEECNKSFKTTYNLHTHNLSFHQHEEDGVHACEFCPQKFPRRKLLEFHKPTHIPKDQWSFFCMKCPTPRPFASEYLLKTHESVHKRETNICHVCAKEIKDKYLFEKHVRLHFEDSGPRVKCPYPDCESWLKDEYNLKDHLRRHNSEGIIYKCPECDKVCKNRKALSQHKRNNHSNRQYKCSQCEKVFKKAITLKEHMAHHTGESLYKCPFCPRTFNSNANMYSHKKKQHSMLNGKNKSDKAAF
ncbi:transcription factor grauzone-like [Musca vetustissima]|uniref:transcription factor grauzone-like n=1 Tax=Musca vetustissima TaxID=27455 RepID=UPI002AB61893|nr:transcription factor grauzone-like [Musca vetustissima]